MLPSPVRVETAVSAADPSGMSSRSRYLWEEMPITRADNRNLGIALEVPLSYTRPEKLNESLLTAPRGPMPSAISSEFAQEQNKDENRTHEIKNEPVGSTTVSDDRKEHLETGKPSAEGKAEKRKMKRFRLTHNQTRFLMSEFTRQAHPDAAHRERLSREIPGLSPRQVQVWFQNRRAKLKRLTGNDRERMLKSRALPEDFDTSQVLRSPFDGKSSPETAMSSPRNFMSPNNNNGSLKMLLTDGLPRPHDGEYVVSPLGSAPAYITPSTPDRNPEQFPQSAALLNRAPLSAPIANFQRNGQEPYSFPRSNSCSEPYAQHAPLLHQHERYPSVNSDSLAHTVIPQGQRPVDYGISRPSSTVVGGYDGRQQQESPISPAGPGNAPVHYGIQSPEPHVHGYQSHIAIPTTKSLSGLEMNSQIPPQSRHLPMSSAPVSDAPPYRPMSYHHPYAVNTMTFAQANPSTISLPTSFRHSDAGNAPPSHMYSPTDERINQPTNMEPPRTGPPFDYPHFI